MAPAGPERYTRFGYLDNPRHAWRLSRSGVVRTLEDALGFAWHYPSFPGPYGQRWIYQASLAVDLGAGDVVCEHHSKNLFRYRVGGVATVEFFLDGDALLGRIEAPVATGCTARAAYVRQLGHSGDWDFGLLARQDADGAGHLATYAEGTAFVLLGDRIPDGTTTDPGDEGWPDRSRPVQKQVEHRYTVGRDGRLTVVLARAESSQAALAEARRALAGAEPTRDRRLAEDAAFWSGAPRLAGDWPDHWRRGFVYDLETLRAIVRQPAGVYRSRWDGMQLQVPRVVLAETALDMLLLSYADPDTAMEVMLGTLRDAIAPNVPCTREDGSVNMVAIDGSACGTSPAWCWPFWCVGLLDARSADRAWLAELYPHLEAFLDWWLVNRLGPDGEPFYLCGWESGQDASPRFNAAERGGGGIEAVHPVDLCAGIAHAARLLSRWARALGRDGSRWEAVAHGYAARTRAMWHGGWFHDWTAAGPTRPRDPMQLAPLMCGVASPEQADALKRHLRDLPGHGEYSPLEWPPVALTVLESACHVGEREWAAETAAGMLERVWRATDASSHAPGRPLPGVAHEHWPPEGEWHTEGYGWGATTVLLFLRYVVGLRDEPELDDLLVEPALPRALRVPGRRYQLVNIPWRSERLDLTYSVEPDGRVDVAKSWSRR